MKKTVKKYEVSHLVGQQKGNDIDTRTIVAATSKRAATKWARENLKGIIYDVKEL